MRAVGWDGKEDSQLLPRFWPEPLDKISEKGKMGASIEKKN